VEIVNRTAFCRLAAEARCLLVRASDAMERLYQAGVHVAGSAARTVAANIRQPAEGMR
jgi:hypothetical protein